MARLTGAITTDSDEDELYEIGNELKLELEGKLGDDEPGEDGEDIDTATDDELCPSPLPPHPIKLIVEKIKREKSCFIVKP